jgi:hypothetical protein
MRIETGQAHLIIGQLRCFQLGYVPLPAVRELYNAR